MTSAPRSHIRRTPLVPVQQLQGNRRAAIQGTPHASLPIVGASNETPIRQSPIITARTAAYRAFAATYPEFIAEIRRLRQYKQLALSRLAAMPRRQQRSEVRRLLHSPRLATFYAYRAVLKAGLITAATPASIASVAAQCNPFQHCHEHVEWLTITNGERERSVQKFGPIKRMMQALVADIIRAIHPPRDNQFVYHGGIPAALSAVDEAFDEGFTHTVELDAVGFYASVPQSLLADVLHPLPGAVIRHVVWDESIRRVASPRTTISVSAMVPPALNETTGLSLGAASSSVVGEVIIATLLARSETAFQPKVITYADNLLVFGRSEHDAEASAARLAALAETSSGGSLRFRARRNGAIATGEPDGTPNDAHVGFVGQVGTRQPGGQVSWAPADHKLAEHRAGEINPHLTLEGIERAERQVTAWRRAYPLWSEGDVWEARHLAPLACARYMRQPSHENLSAASRAILTALDTVDAATPVTEFIPDHGRQEDEVNRAKLIEAATTFCVNVRHAARASSQ